MKNKDLNYDVLADVIVSRFKENELVEHEFLETFLSIQAVKYTDYDSEEEYNKARELVQFEYLQKIENLRKSLLENHNYYFLNVLGKGYILPDPDLQAKTALKKTKNGIRKNVKKGHDQLTYIDSQRVDVKIMNKARDRMAAWSMIKGML